MMSRWSFKPFIFAAIFWAALSIGTIMVFGSEPQNALFSFFILFVLVCFDLFFLGKSVAVLSVLLSDQVSEKRTLHTIRLALWGSAKLVALVALIAVIWNLKQIRALPLFLGLGTLMVVPFLGGLGWTWVEELKNERSKELAEN